MTSDNDQSTILKQYADGPTQLERAVAGLDDSGLDATGAKGGWSIRQIVHHIVDGDDIWKWCIKSALGNDGGEFTLKWYGAFAQEVWADRWEYSARSIDVSLTLLKANREHLMQLLKHVPDSWERSFRLTSPNGQIETVTVGQALKIQTEHVTHHIKQIAAIRGS